ncbi:MAG: DNA polymerase IV [Burkholderiales bacterium]|nr:DNA polymerase IV [Burkholderiales bacterium]
MNANITLPRARKIIHLDMDCFYAAVEIRDRPELASFPVAVGGSSDRRGVLCTCNYLARKFGVRSAMATATALRICPKLVVLPVNMAKYKQVSRQIQAIFREYTELVEPLSLDEAFLDVSNSAYHNGSASLIAEEIRQRIWDEHQLTASAGVSVNKFLAKVASAWNKPNGLCVVRPDQIEQFVATLPVNKLFGVGKVTADKLSQLQITTCADLQQFSLLELSKRFGKLGQALYYQARGIDNREVTPNRPRKSLSVETTFAENIVDIELAKTELSRLYDSFTVRLADAQIGSVIRSAFIKIKFADFTQSTSEISLSEPSMTAFLELFVKNNQLYLQKPIRLLGLGVSFKIEEEFAQAQQDLFHGLI